jgi:hypothetical protein
LTSTNLPACTAPADSAQAPSERRRLARRIIWGTLDAEPDRSERTFPVDTPYSIFVNGLSGVFVGIGMLYLMMKLLAVLSDRWAKPASKSESGTTK